MTFQGFSFQPSTFTASNTPEADAAPFGEARNFAPEKSEMFVLTFTDAERDRIAEAFAAARLSQFRGRLAEFTAASRDAFERSASAETLRLLFDIRTDARALAAAAFKNLPLADQFVAEADADFASFREGILCGVGAALGVPYGLGSAFDEFDDGRFAAFEAPARAAGRRGFHMETTALHGLDGVNRFPDWVAFAGGAQASVTMSVADGRLALARCPAWVEEAFRAESVIFGGRDGFRPFASATEPGDAASFRFVLDGHFATPAGSTLPAACEIFAGHLAETATAFELTPDSLLLIDNHFGFHAFEPFPEEPAFTPPFRLFVTANRRRLVDWRPGDGGFFEEVGRV